MHGDGELKDSIAPSHAELMESLARREGQFIALEAKMDGILRVMRMMVLLLLAILVAVLALPFLYNWYG